MKELLEKYSINEILIFIIMLALAIKGFVTFYDWAKGRLKQFFNKETDNNERNKELTDRIDTDEKKINDLIELHKKTEKDIQELNKSVNMLIDSDKDDIKSWITEQHHKFCYGKSKTIDTYSLDCIERRYSHYVDEGGNSFVHTLMEDLRKLTVYYPEQDNDNNNEK